MQNVFCLPNICLPSCQFSASWAHERRPKEERPLKYSLGFLLRVNKYDTLFTPRFLLHTVFLLRSFYFVANVGTNRGILLLFDYQIVSVCLGTLLLNFARNSNFKRSQLQQSFLLCDVCVFS